MRIARLAALAALLAAGCAHVPLATKDQDAAVKAFATRPDSANLYVYRASSFGSAVKFPVSVDGKLVGSLPGSTFLMVMVAPGPHTVEVQAESDKNLTFTAAAGRNHYVKVTPAMGWISANANLYLMDDKETEAQEDVRGCDLIQGR